jgi:hypothetical protein
MDFVFLCSAIEKVSHEVEATLDVTRHTRTPSAFFVEPDTLLPTLELTS